jgi:hypothetical protein
MFSGINPLAMIEMTSDDTVWRSLFLFYNERHIGIYAMIDGFFSG